MRAWRPWSSTTCAVGDRVWHDWNHTWMQDDRGESGVAGVRVTLLDGTGKVVASTTSSGPLFSNLAPGTTCSSTRGT
jgi:hypothetical protein